MGCAAQKQTIKSTQQIPPNRSQLKQDNQQINDENVMRVKQQFESLASLLEQMTAEFKSITDSLKQEHKSQFPQQSQ